MSCQKIKEKFPDYLIGDLDKNSTEEIQAHVSSCSPCREELEGMSAMWTKLGVLSEEQPSNNLRSRFYTMLEDYKQDLNEQKSTHRWQESLRNGFKHLWPRQPAFQFSLSLIFLMIGIATGYFLNSNGQNPSQLASLRQEVQSMNQTLAISLLDQNSPGQRLKGINLSYSIENPEQGTLERLLHTLDNDPNVNVRLAAVDALYLFFDYPIVREGLILSLTKQTSPLVQVSLIDLIVEMRERRAVDALKLLIKNEELIPEVKQHAELGIEKIM